MPQVTVPVVVQVFLCVAPRETHKSLGSTNRSKPKSCDEWRRKRASGVARKLGHHGWGESLRVSVPEKLKRCLQYPNILGNSAAAYTDAADDYAVLHERCATTHRAKAFL